MTYREFVIVDVMASKWVSPSSTETISSAERAKLEIVCSVLAKKYSCCKKKQILSACSMNSAVYVC